MAPYGVPQHPVHSGLLSGLRIRFSHLAMALLHVNDWPYEDLIPLGNRRGSRTKWQPADAIERAMTSHVAAWKL